MVKGKRKGKRKRKGTFDEPCAWATTPRGGQPRFMHTRGKEGAMRVCCLCGMARLGVGAHLCTAEVVSLLNEAERVSEA